jgi:hypothetical protein
MHTLLQATNSENPEETWDVAIAETGIVWAYSHDAGPPPPSEQIMGGGAVDTSILVYRHFKGGRYRPLLLAQPGHVVYISLVYGQIWVRPISMWNEYVEWPDGVRRSRFVPETDEICRMLGLHIARLP